MDQEQPLIELFKIENLNVDYQMGPEEDEANESDDEFYETFQLKVEKLDPDVEIEENFDEIYRPEDHQIELVEEEEIYPCIICNFQSTSLKDITEHLSTHDRTGRFQCQFCDFQSNTKNDFNTHLRKHRYKSRKLQNIDAAFKCKECLFETQHCHSLKRHYLRHKPPQEENLFRCYQCPYTSRFKHNLKVHVLLHTDGNYQGGSSREPAPYYEKSFYNHYDYKFISSDGKKCLLCGFTSSYPNYVKKHMRRKHASEMGIETKSFQCFHCTFETKIKYSLQTHLFRVHQKGVALPSKEKTKKTPLKKGDRYICEICNFKSFHISEVEVHKLSHDNIEHSDVFTCKLCNFKSIYKSCMNRHKLIHLPNKGKRFKCDLCKYSANRKDEMKGHILRCHIKEKEKEEWSEEIS
ncbi:zinc finger Y-chromosomal protein-like isoform X2 [Anthonomus grandis grandis]|uniref:zinc finger Y-chromosomal protein-like isoform X2 n=1 Tax=Anthonomus grandis grandis TaxID=2921223 RepID=UPI002166132D|nr:zinc finger Y-chromosomal protein-like isoform X2 [Anthonomus grandis grandis]